MKAIVKTVKRYGNSGGVYVPNNWIGGKVKVELVEEPLDIRMDLLNKIPLEHVISVILYGSYARKEQSEMSDIDVILVTDEDARIEIPEEVKKRYDIQVKTIRQLRNAVMHDPLFYKIIKDEGVTIINHQVLSELKEKQPELNRIESRLSLIESSLNITKKMHELGNDKDIIYPLMLRLKEILLIEYLIENKKYSTDALKKEILRHRIKSRDFSMLINLYRALRDKKNTSKYHVSGELIASIISILEEKVQNVREKTGKKRH